MSRHGAQTHPLVIGILLGLGFGERGGELNQQAFRGKQFVGDVEERRGILQGFQTAGINRKNLDETTARPEIVRHIKFTLHDQERGIIEHRHGRHAKTKISRGQARARGIRAIGKLTGRLQLGIETLKP